MKREIEHVLRLPPGAGNPRNSEGDFLRLADGRWMFVYTHFYGGDSDHAPAYLAARYSADEGATWMERDVVILPNEAGMNVMSVSLLRLASGQAALFYLRKESTSDCRPYMRLLHELIPPHEPGAWGPAIPIIPDERAGYYVMNNDRVTQLDSGRLIAPVAYHRTTTGGMLDPYGVLQCYLSDDEGQTWYAGEPLAPARHEGHPVMLQEPGVIPLRDGRLMLFSRTDAGCQYLAYSQDGGVSWTPPRPSAIRSPLSPASIKRIPTTGD
ncbi:MAG TPA: exo-alpha-sialidase, partial [Chloroflexi bacterium]|nr:exo-alpha-sialidase [Chloroflexota bacterium]